MNLPWELILDIERSGLAEIAISGIISVIDGMGNEIISLGNKNALIWTRSCIKPWQLLNHIHILKKHYPALQNKHYTLMLSSHSAEIFHQSSLDEIMSIAEVDQSVLQNTPAYPINPKLRIETLETGSAPCSYWADCSGKHLGYILALKAEGKDFSNYKSPQAEHFIRLKQLFAYLLQLENNTEQFPDTVDGCTLPNQAMTAPQLAKLYCQLAYPLAKSKIEKNQMLIFPSKETCPNNLEEIMQNFDSIATLMADYPLYVGGTDRFDTELMQEKYTKLSTAKLIAKEGADGLMCIGVAPCQLYKQGLGIVIKSASGTDIRYFRLIVLKVLEELNLLSTSAETATFPNHLKFNYHLNKLECSIH